jgi:hypothetical protein
MSIDNSSGRDPDALHFITALQRPGDPRIAAEAR